MFTVKEAKSMTELEKAGYRVYNLDYSENPGIGIDWNE